MLVRIATILILILSTSLPAAAQVTPPAGWTTERATPRGIVLVSAPDAAGKAVRAVLAPAQPLGGDFSEWHSRTAREKIANVGGTVAWSSEIIRQANIAVQSFTVVGKSNRQETVFVYGYSVPEALDQLVMIVFPAEFGNTHPQVQAAVGMVTDLWQRNFTLRSTDAAATTPPATPPSAPSQPAPSATSGAVGEAAVETVLFHTRRFINNRIIPSTTLLLKNGAAYLEEPKSPLDFKASTRPNGSSGVGAWQLTSEGYRITWSDGATEKTVSDTGKTAPAASGQRFAGTFAVNMASDALPWADVTQFRPDGTFTVLQDGTNKVMGNGNYRVTGWTVEIALNGQAKRWLFGLQGNPQAPDVLVVGDVIFRRR